MVLESTMICIDNSNFMRNGDFLPTRLLAQQDAVNLVCHSKTRSNPENNVGLLTLANVEVLATLTNDVGHVIAKLNKVEPDGDVNILTGIRIAHLALKHRQGKNHKMRIVVFIGSPIENSVEDFIRLGKRLKKEKVNVDMISFGEEQQNSAVLTTFINTINGKDGQCSHLVTIPNGPHLSDALVSSPVLQGDQVGGPSTAGFEFGVDPNIDPELALALRVSMEEQRHIQNLESRTTSDHVIAEMPSVPEATSEEAMLERALAMSLEAPMETDSIDDMDISAMTESEQIAFAMRMSIQQDSKTPSETNETMTDVEFSETAINNPAYLEVVLQNLPGMENLDSGEKDGTPKNDDKKKKEEEKKKKKDDKDM